MPARPIKKRGPASKPKEVLLDSNNDVSPVKIQGGSTEEVEISQEQPAPQRKSGPGFFETLMSRGRYDRIRYFAGRIGNDKFLKHIYPLVKTLEQYNGIVDYLRRHNLVASFYVYGDIDAVKGAIIESKVYDGYNSYFGGGDLETALALALKENRHDRAIELLDVRKGITAEKDEQREPGGETSFGRFVHGFLYDLAPWKDGMAFRRFFILRGNELRSKHHDILDTLCQELVGHLKFWIHLPRAEKLLIDLIGQPSLLSPVAFAKGFLNYMVYGDELRSVFIKYGWCEAFHEGLKTEYRGGGKGLWFVMKKEYPDQFFGQFPDTEEARVAACMRLPTKQQKEDEWHKKYFMILFNQLNNLDFLPTVSWSIISEYAVLFIATMDLTISAE